MYGFHTTIAYKTEDIVTFKKLSSKETKRTKQLFEEYNGTCYELDHQHSPIPLEDILLPSSDFWANLPAPSVDSKFQRYTIQAVLMQRSKEEKKLLEGSIPQSLGSKVDNQFSRGAICSLQPEWEAELHQSKDLIELPAHLVMIWK